MMHAYIAVRAECEAAIESAALQRHDLASAGMSWARGIGGRICYFPFTRLRRLVPPTRDGARRLGLVTLEQMTSALTVAVENPVQGRRLVTVPEIRSARA